MERSEVFGPGGSELIDDAKSLAEQTEEKHRTFLQALRENDEESGSTTQVTLVEGFEVTVRTRIDGRILDRLGDMEANLEAAQDGTASVKSVSDTAHQAAELLEDLITDEEYDTPLFLHVYEEEGLEVLGTFLEAIFEAIGEVKQEQQEAADSFRPAE